MGDVVRTTREPMLGPIRLAWWRERLEELDEAQARRPSRGCRRSRASCCRAGSAARDLAGLEAGWLRLFDPFPWATDTSEAIWLRGNLLFGLGARVLGEPSEQIQAAGGRGRWSTRRGIAATAIARLLPSRRRPLRQRRARRGACGR